MKKVILLHGKDKTSQDVWYPWLAAELSKRGIACYAPDLPHAQAPRINEWLAVIDALGPDEDTILVGHSRGGMAILRWLERANKKVAAVILVAGNSATIQDAAKGDFYSGPYNFEALRAACGNYIVLHSKDDEWVPYEAALENAAGLHAKLISFDNKGHFGRQPDGSLMGTFPELLAEVAAAERILL